METLKDFFVDGLRFFRQQLLSDTPVEDNDKQALSLAGAYNLQEQIDEFIDTTIDSIYPVGSLYISANSTLPLILSTGRTWTMLSGEYVLKTITTGEGGTTTETSETGGNSGNTGASNVNTGASNVNTSAITLTAEQTGIRQHNHTASGSTSGHAHTAKGTWDKVKQTGTGDVQAELLKYNSSGTSSVVVNTNSTNLVSSVTVNNVSAAKATSSHTHTLNNHTHTLNNHTHTLNNHTHTTGMPTNIGVYVWKRTE